MKAVGYIQSLPASDARSLLDFDLPQPVPGPLDLLVEVRAVSVNPIDCKQRMRNLGQPNAPCILGFDCAGVVVDVGSDVKLFRPDDEVFYAGSIQRPGANCEFHVVDERLVGPKPRTLSFASSAALPLTSITAWELLFDRLRVPRLDPGWFGPGGRTRPSRGSEGSLLILGAAGGVGSILTQLARQLTNLTVIGSASRPASRQWVTDCGAHYVIDHAQDLATELAAVGIEAVDYVISLTHTEEHFAQIAEVLAPQGAMALIDDPGPLDLRVLKAKSIALHWESMFTRSSYQTHDMIEQQHILRYISTYVDISMLHSTIHASGGRINAENLRLAHQQLESQSSIGKLVLEGF